MDLADHLENLLHADWRQQGTKRVRQEESLWAHAGACAAVAGLTPIEERVSDFAAARAAATPHSAAAAARPSGSHSSSGAAVHTQPDSGQRRQRPAPLAGNPPGQHRQDSTRSAAATASVITSAARQGAARQAPSTTAGVRLAALREELAAAEAVQALHVNDLLTVVPAYADAGIRTARHIAAFCMQVVLALGQLVREAEAELGSRSNDPAEVIILD